MKAVIMAGGEGSRLRPLTCDLPKPMARLCGRPVIEYILDLLGEHGVEEAAVTVRYLPDRIVEHFPGARYGDIRLHFVEETAPLGTAGSVRGATGPEDDDVLVISGDAMCDFDLGAFAADHRRSGAAVSILAKKVEDPREYGLIDADADMRVTGFIEKPAYSQAISDLANTGIYMLSRRALEAIPPDRMYDFAKDLFPALLAAGERLQCWEGDGYWCDIGDLQSYIDCQRDMLEGLVRCELRGERDRDGNLFAGSPPTCLPEILPPVYIGRNVRLGERVLLERGTVLDDGCAVGRQARLSGTVVLPGAQIGQRARMTGALVCAGAAVKEGAMLFEGATVGAGAVIGARSTLAAGVKVWNRKRVPEASQVQEHVKHGGPERSHFGDEGIAGQVGVELTPEFCARLGAAVGSVNPQARIAVGCSTHRSAKVLKAALCAGIQSTGAHVIDFGSSFAAQFEFSMNFCAADLGVFVKGDSRAWLRLITAGGLPATRQVEREVEGFLLRGEFARVSFDGMGDRVEMNNMAAMYRSQLMRAAPGGLAGLGVRVRCHNPYLRNTLREVLGKLGCDAEGPLLVELSSQGDRVRVHDPDYGTVHYHSLLAACAAGEMERGRDVALPFDAPRSIDRLAAAMGRRVLRYFSCPADDSDREARELAANQMWSRDALMLAVMFLQLVVRHGAVAPLMERWPHFEVSERTLDTPGNPAGLLRAVGEHRYPGSGSGVEEGVLIRQDKGIALVKPLKRGGGIRIQAEAASSETAAELCGDVEEMLRRVMRGEGLGG